MVTVVRRCCEAPTVNQSYSLIQVKKMTWDTRAFCSQSVVLFCPPGTEVLRLPAFGPPIVAVFIRMARKLAYGASARQGAGDGCPQAPYNPLPLLYVVAR